jgi:predicted RNA-binding Zn-ribbon protein involved in translation (DUF1610 family)
MIRMPCAKIKMAQDQSFFLQITGEFTHNDNFIQNNCCEKLRVRLMYIWRALKCRIKGLDNKCEVCGLNIPFHIKLVYSRGTFSH